MTARTLRLALASAAVAGLAGAILYAGKLGDLFALPSLATFAIGAIGLARSNDWGRSRSKRADLDASRSDYIGVGVWVACMVVVTLMFFEIDPLPFIAGLFR